PAGPHPCYRAPSSRASPLAGGQASCSLTVGRFFKPSGHGGRFEKPSYGKRASPQGAAMSSTDAFDQELVSQTHPSDWANPEPAGCYNLVVVGAGTAGLVSAAGAAGLGAKVALVEKHRLGGDCLHYGCVPSKALIRCARAAAEARRSEEFG